MGYSVQREEPASSIVKIKKKKESKKEKESGILYRKVGRRCGCGIHFIPDTSLLPLLCFYSFFFMTYTFSQYGFIRMCEAITLWDLNKYKFQSLTLQQ